MKRGKNINNDNKINKFKDSLGQEGSCGCSFNQVDWTNEKWFIEAW